MATIFLDKNRVQVKDGDILFYREPAFKSFSGDMQSSLTDSLHIIEENNGELYGRTIIGNNGVEYVLREDKKGIALNHYCYYGDDESIMHDALVIGNIKENPERLTVEYASHNYPLKK